MKRLWWILGMMVLVASCTDREDAPRRDADRATETMVDVETAREAARSHRTFREYWYRGLAELSAYDLEQSRYDEIHEGHAVLVSVTEPFLEDLQVKHEFGDNPNSTSVLKVNHYRRFYTGVYPYTLMTSTFTPARKPGKTLKLATSVIEWCGMVFAQLNLRDAGYEGVSYSYFQSEGDEKFELEPHTLEDELWARVRIAPDELPTGQVKMIPAFHYLRMAHKDFGVRTAGVELSQARDTEYSEHPVRTYSIDYDDIERKVVIHFEDDFPHRIVAWEEKYPAIFDREGGQPEVRTTRARLKRSILLDYWDKNRNVDEVFQKALGLD